MTQPEKKQSKKEVTLDEIRRRIRESPLNPLLASRTPPKIQEWIDYEKQLLTEER